MNDRRKAGIRLKTEKRNALLLEKKDEREKKEKEVIKERQIYIKGERRDDYNDE